MSMNNFTHGGIKLFFLESFKLDDSGRVDFLNLGQGFPIRINLRQ